MPKASKADKPKIPDIPWAEDDFKLVSASLTELEKVENYNWALFGKKTPGEVSSTWYRIFQGLKMRQNTSGKSWNTIFKCIAKLFELDPGAISDQLKGQMDR